MIVSPKKPPMQMHFRWDPDLCAEIEALAARTNRTLNETGELLMRWAVERAKQELELMPPAPKGEPEIHKPKKR